MTEYAGKRSNTQDLGPTQSVARSGVPGKQTLVEQAFAGAVQRRAEGDAAHAPAVHAAAAEGVATPSSQLPHRETIQRAFGRFDVSGVQAHTGTEAAASARAMGAQAYATGDHVVLGAGTDLHTVAHEAAHVVQQRGGVQLKGGVGEIGDSYEQHADAVADAVVQGKSAEPILAKLGGAEATAKYQTVQLLRSKLDNAIVDIGGLQLVRVFDILRRKDPDPDPAGFTFEEGDRDKLHARAGALLPDAFRQLINAQTSGSDLGVMARRNVKVTPADQQLLIQFMQKMASEGVVSGLDQWMAYVSAHSGDSTEHAENRQDHMNELWEAARRIVFEGARHVDLSESDIPGTAQTADLKVGDTQVEIKTVRDPIRTAGDLTGQLAAGLAKFAGAPVGSYEVTVFASIDESLFGGGKEKGGKSPSKTVADPVGLTITTSYLHPKTKEPILDKAGKPRQTAMSLIDELVAYLNRETNRDPHNPKGADRVGKVNIILENAASYQAVKTDGGWQGRLL